jgi:hypothetical protein
MNMETVYRDKQQFGFLYFEMIQGFSFARVLTIIFRLLTSNLTTRKLVLIDSESAFG